MFHAASVGLGVMGVLSTVTLHCIPAFALQQTVSWYAPGEDAATSMPELAKQHEYLAMLWMPYSDRFVSITANRVASSATSSVDGGAGVMTVIQRAYRRVMARLVQGLLSAGARFPSQAVTRTVHGLLPLSWLAATDDSTHILTAPVPACPSVRLSMYVSSAMTGTFLQSLRAALQEELSRPDNP